MNQWDILLENTLNIFIVTMTTIVIATMVTMVMPKFSPKNCIFGPGDITSKELHEQLAFICVLLHGQSRAVLEQFWNIDELLRYSNLFLKFSAFWWTFSIPTLDIS